MKEFLRKLNSSVSPNYMPDASCIEKADKIIDRGAKVLGTLAIVGAVTGLIIHAAK